MVYIFSDVFVPKKKIRRKSKNLKILINKNCKDVLIKSKSLHCLLNFSKCLDTFKNLDFPPGVRYLRL